MGSTNKIIIPFYQREIKNNQPTALLGFTNNDVFKGDLYDFEMDNWNINTCWKLKQKYNTIICTRCAYFAKDPEDLIKRCYDNLSDNGMLYIDWGLGDHWRFKNFKVGWVKDGEQEFCYDEDNYLWSAVWDDSFLDDEQCKVFCEAIKQFGYNDLKKAVFEEVPSILTFDIIKKYFEVDYKIISTSKPYAQMYTLIKGKRK